jgi:hypothetical protein
MSAAAGYLVAWVMLATSVAAGHLPVLVMLVIEWLQDTCLFR